MDKKPKFKPLITRVHLNPEQAVLSCNCWSSNKYWTTINWGLAWNNGSGTVTACNWPQNPKGGAGAHYHGPTQADWKHHFASGQPYSSSASS